MEAFAHPRGSWFRGGHGGDANGRGKPVSRNKQWVAGEANSRLPSTGHTDGDRWERGAFHGRGRGRGAQRGGPPRKFPNSTLRITHEPKATVEQTLTTTTTTMVPGAEDDNDEPLPVINEPMLETQEEREKLYQELVAAREQERKSAIAEGKMDDPLVPKRLEDAITIVGTCLDMCPRFERYRRERENNLFEWETIPGTKRIDHKRAVKMYERAAGDKTLPSDLRPPHVLRKTLDYLFHDLLPRGTLSRTAQFIRDRSRAVRNDITMQHLTGRLAIECHDRCARFHILVMHFERDRPGFSLPLEEQQLMNTLQSLKEFYEDQRGRYESPTELEMRVYHRLIHIRDQKERHENIPEHISSHPVFKLTTDFRLHVQKKSEPITKTSALKVDAQAMNIFGHLASYLRDMGDTAMIYMVACILERLFGTDTIENIEAIRGELIISDIIDGKSGAPSQITELQESEEDIGMEENGIEDEDYLDDLDNEQDHVQDDSFADEPTTSTWSNPPAFVSQHTSSMISGQTSTVPVHGSAFATLTEAPNVFGKTFGIPASKSAPTSVFGTFNTTPSAPTPSPQRHVQTFPSSRPPPPVFPPSMSAQTIAPPPSEPAPFPPASASTPPAPPPSTEPAPAPKGSNFYSSFFAPPSSSSTAPFAPVSTTPSNHFQPPPTNAPSLNPEALSFTPSSTFSTAPPPRDPSPPPQGGQKLNGVQTEATTRAPSPLVAPLLSRGQSNSSSSSNFSSTPPPLKIDTSVSSSSATSTVNPSPREPPSLNRVQPVSLPSTPTMYPPPSALLSYLKGNMSTPPSSATPERSVLSPLLFQTPRTSALQPPILNNFSPIPAKPALGIIGLNGKGKAPARESELPAEVLEMMQAKACAFEQTGSVLRECFGLWLRKAIDRAAYIEACKQSDAYREKMRLHKSQNGTADRKRRISIALPAESPQRKRARKRASSAYQAPRTDEELAQRFKENQEDVERRWAQGSFLHAFKTFFQRHQGTKQLPSTWQIWLSMNPESDATAIWIERKFDVPNSGKWISESVFSIPIGVAPRSGKDHPGLIVLECTPVEGIDDEIERKYRILDDCSRLRDIVKGFPSRRYYVPSILFLCWARSSDQYPDLFAMADKLFKDRTIKGYHTLLLNAADKDPDEKLIISLENTSVDVEGELVRGFSVRDLYKHFLALLNGFVTEWVGSCSNADFFNWKLYNLLLNITVVLLNNLERGLCQLCEVPESSSFGLAEFEDNTIDDSDSAYDYAEEWLTAISSHINVSLVLIDIQSHRNIEQDFPSRTFLDHVLEIAQIQGCIVLGENRMTHFVLLADLHKSTTELEESLAPLRIKLSHRLNKTSRRSPKRRSHSATTSDASPESKRMRLSSASSMNGDTATPFSSPFLNGDQYTPLSPSLSVASSLPPASTEVGGPKVTAAMLRALTQDLKKKYIRHS